MEQLSQCHVHEPACTSMYVAIATTISPTQGLGWLFSTSHTCVLESVLLGVRWMKVEAEF